MRGIITRKRLLKVGLKIFLTLMIWASVQTLQYVEGLNPSSFRNKYFWLGKTYWKKLFRKRLLKVGVIINITNTIYILYDINVIIT